jgi:hypothetical protein
MLRVEQKTGFSFRACLSVGERGLPARRIGLWRGGLFLVFQHVVYLSCLQIPAHGTDPNSQGLRSAQFEGGDRRIPVRNLSAYRIPGYPWILAISTFAIGVWQRQPNIERLAEQHLASCHDSVVSHLDV